MLYIWLHVNLAWLAFDFHALSFFFSFFFLNMQGRFEILSLSGSFLLTENGGQRSRTGGLSVSLSGPDGRVLGGGVAGLLTAATPIQVLYFFFFFLVCEIYLNFQF